MLLIASSAKRRTSLLGSDSEFRNAGSAICAAGPMERNAIHALFRDPSSGLDNNVISSGTADFASGPISPRACAAHQRTFGSPSRKAVASTGRAGLTSVLDHEGSNQVPARTSKARATFFLS